MHLSTKKLKKLKLVAYKKISKTLFFFSLGLSLGLGFVLFIVNVPAIIAADVNVSACVAKTEICNNSIDDDCDSLVDCEDPSCSSDAACTTTALCGNNIREGTEQCDGTDHSNCSSGACLGTCVCAGGGGCTPGATTCGDWGNCGADNKQSRSCGNGCQSWSETRDCLFACGDNNVDADGIDNIPATADDEECDDGNTVSGDCCSLLCKQELIVTAGQAEVGSSSATINWSAPCNLSGTNFLLEWGTELQGAAVIFSDSVSTTNFSHTLSGLTQNTLYYYKITAQSGLLTADTGVLSFRTTGAVEICNNGVDDNSNGYCDYPASTCADGSQPGDVSCQCTPAYICSPVGECQPDGTRSVVCVDQTSPKCQPNSVGVESCGGPQCQCPGACARIISTQPCVCGYRDLCCGNTYCEPASAPPENFESCPVDCLPLPCVSDWGNCNDLDWGWQPVTCPASGIQTRTCVDNNACPTPTNPPPTSRACGPTCTGLTCTGRCEQVNLASCSCDEAIPCCGNGRCESGENYQTCRLDCIEPCVPNWITTEWGQCINGIQERSYYDLNNCPFTASPPPTQRCCLEGCNVACGQCERLDPVARVCQQITPCCGNRICEEGEKSWSCPADCGVPPEYGIELPQCLDGLDNDNDGFVDYPADPSCESPTDRSEFGLDNLLEILTNRTLQENFVVPTLITVATINVITAVSFFNILSYLRYLFTQPIASFFRRRRRKWGIVYDSLTKNPVDLAIVRLYDYGTKRLLQSRVTDRRGRYNFLVKVGSYYLVVAKPNYVFPTEYLKSKTEDVKYLDLYHGEEIKATEDRAVITANIPLDPLEDSRTPAKIIFQYYLRKLQYALAFMSVPLAIVSVVVAPGFYTVALLGIHCILYILFRRLGYQRPPRSWGIVYDKDSRQPIALAIARIYDKQYNKLLESRVTDSKGRYAFLVDNNIYYLTFEKSGYQQEKTEDIDLVHKKREEIVALDIGLEKGKGLPTAPATPKPPVVSPGESLNKEGEVKKDSSVGLPPLEELSKAKESVEEIKTEIAEEKEKLEDLEQKIEEIDAEIKKEVGPAVPATEAEESKSVTEPKSAQETPPTDKNPKDTTPQDSIFG